MADEVTKTVDAAKRTPEEPIIFKVADGFDNFVSRVGLNNNNMLSASMYTFNYLTQNRLQLEAAYRGSWVVGQVIDTVAEDMTKAGITMSTAEKFDQRKVKREIVRRGIEAGLCSLIKWGRLYGGAIAVIQIEGQDMASPLDVSTIAKNQFKGLVVYDRWQVTPELTDVIETGPNMGMPRFYDIVTGWTSGDPTARQAVGQVKVHHSRVIRSIGVQLPYMQAIVEMMWGESVIERMYDRLISFDNTTMSTANLVERANNRTVKIEKLREIIAAGGKAQKGLEAQFEMMREFQSNEGLTLLDKEDEFSTTQYTFSGLSDVLLQFGQQLSGATGIPLVRLFGQSPAGLSATGDSDLRTYYDNINSQQNAKLTGAWELIMKCLWRSVFGKDLPDDFDFEFVPLWQMSDKEKADTANVNTQSITTAHTSGLITRATALKELRQQSSATGVFTNITDEEIKEAEEMDENPPLPDEPAAPEPEAESEETPAEQIDRLLTNDSMWSRLKRWAGKKKSA